MTVLWLATIFFTRLTTDVAVFLLVACLLDALPLSPSLFPCSIPFRKGGHKCINNVLRSFNQTIYWLSANLEKKRKNSFSLQRSIILFLHSNFVPKKIIHVKNRISVSNLVRVFSWTFILVCSVAWNVCLEILWLSQHFNCMGGYFRFDFGTNLFLHEGSSMQ